MSVGVFIPRPPATAESDPREPKFPSWPSNAEAMDELCEEGGNKHDLCLIANWQKQSNSDCEQSSAQHEPDNEALMLDQKDRDIEQRNFGIGGGGLRDLLIRDRFGVNCRFCTGSHGNIMTLHRKPFQSLSIARNPPISSGGTRICASLDDPA